jgi:hypothetical protein
MNAFIEPASLFFTAAAIVLFVAHKDIGAMVDRRRNRAGKETGRR